MDNTTVYSKIFSPHTRTNHQPSCKLPTYSPLNDLGLRATAACQLAKTLFVFSRNRKIHNIKNCFTFYKKEPISHIPPPLDSCYATSRPIDTCFARFPNLLFFFRHLPLTKNILRKSLKTLLGDATPKQYICFRDIFRTDVLSKR